MTPVRGIVSWKVLSKHGKVVECGSVTNRIYPALGRDLLSAMAGETSYLGLAGNNGGIAVDLDGEDAVLASSPVFEFTSDDPADWILAGSASWENDTGASVVASQYLLGRNWDGSAHAFEHLYGATLLTGTVIGNGQTLAVTYRMKWSK